MHLCNRFHSKFLIEKFGRVGKKVYLCNTLNNITRTQYLK